MTYKYTFILTWFLIRLLFPYDVVANFGYIETASYNIGDDFQSIAAKRFLPKSAVPIERDFISEYQSEKITHTIVNGWFMQTGKTCWPYPDFMKPPQKSWPPSKSINPLLISIHFTEYVLPEVLSEEGIAYFKKHAPIGARDFWTLSHLIKNGIPSYFSGCLTLTLENDTTEKDDIIYAVDIDRECVDFIKSKTDCRIEWISQLIEEPMRVNKSQREKFALERLEKYKRARCVVTSRLHTVLPCLAFKTPVILINTQCDQYRFAGLKELLKNCSKEEFLSNVHQFDFNNPPPNPSNYLSLRNNLIKIVTKWVSSIEESSKSTP